MTELKLKGQMSNNCHYANDDVITDSKLFSLLERFCHFFFQQKLKSALFILMSIVVIPKGSV